MRTFATLVILALVTVSFAKLEIKPRKNVEIEYVSMPFPDLSNAESVNDACNLSNPLGVGENTFNDAGNGTYSGYLNINPKTSSALFYMFYKCRNQTACPDYTKVPVVIWLQGGPGSSSLLGAFLELGPNKIVFNNTTNLYEEVAAPNAWNDYYNLLIIENPVGVGYGNINTTSDFTSNETQVANNMVTALVNFYNISNFTNLTTTDLYLFGESYAGHYIPSISDTVINYNAQTTGTKIPLKGSAVGNGWVDPINQLSEYGLFGYALGLIDDNERAQVEQAQLDSYYQILQGQQYIAQGNFAAAAPFMGAALNDFDTVTDTIVNGGGGVNVYNYRIFGGYDALEAPLTAYLNQANTQQKYCTRGSRFGNTTWLSGSAAVYQNMAQYDFMNTVAQNVSNVLNSGLPLMFYNGQDDIICNSPSTQTWLSKLQWNHQTDFYNANTQTWLYNGTHAGFYKNFGSLTYVTVNKAGHLAPMDQIEATTDMLRRFIGGCTDWTNPWPVTEPKSETKPMDEDEFLVKSNLF